MNRSEKEYKAPDITQQKRRRWIKSTTPWFLEDHFFILFIRDIFFSSVVWFVDKKNYFCECLLWIIPSKCVEHDTRRVMKHYKLCTLYTTLSAMPLHCVWCKTTAWQNQKKNFISLINCTIYMCIKILNGCRSCFYQVIPKKYEYDRNLKQSQLSWTIFNQKP